MGPVPALQTLSLRPATGVYSSGVGRGHDVTTGLRPDDPGLTSAVRRYEELARR